MYATPSAMLSGLGSTGSATAVAMRSFADAMQVPMDETVSAFHPIPDILVAS